jgi:hypothetical protein
MSRGIARSPRRPYERYQYYYQPQSPNLNGEEVVRC